MSDPRLQLLSHHEALRYDYLSKNIHFLNDKEKAELAFLTAKMDGAVSEIPTHSDQQVSQNHGLPRYPGQKESKPLSRKSRRQQRELIQYRDEVEPRADFERADELEAERLTHGLPVYPDRRKTSQFSQAQPKPKKVRQVSQAVPEPPKPKKPKKSKGVFARLFKWLLFLILAVFLGMLFMFFKGYKAGTQNYQPAQKEVFNGKDTLNGTNILILGSDKRITQNSTEARTDTIMVMNVGNSDGKMKLVSFMRDTLVNIPGYSTDNVATDLKLNASFTFGEQDHNQGVEFVRQVLKHNFDIDIKYYVMIDFETFAEGIDTLFPEGVEIDATFNTVGGEQVSQVEVPDDLGYAKGGAMYQTITVGKQRMNGKTLLNYARFRGDDTADFGRVTRQQQVMSAILSQVKNPTKLFTGSEAIGKIYALTSTNVSYPLLIKEGLGVVTSGQDGIKRMTVPQQGDWVDTYDMYGGMGLDIDRDKYQGLLAEMGLR